MVEAFEAGRTTVGGYLQRAFWRGLTVTLPILLTIVVFFFAVDFVAGLLEPITFALEQFLGVSEGLPDVVDVGIALLVLLALVVIVGALEESSYGRGGLEHRVDNALATIPGLGAIYSSIDELSTMLIDSDTESFREVKVIEYPFEETYAMAFLTASSTGVVSSAVDEDEMVTVFLPMAPNPMGGFLIHVPEDRVYDVDLTVEEGVQTILSTGVTLEAQEFHELDEFEGSEQASDDGGRERAADAQGAEHAGSEAPGGEGQSRDTDQGPSGRVSGG